MLQSHSALLFISLVLAVAGTSSHAADARPDSREGTIKGSDLIGMKVGSDGESRLGTVQDAIIDLQRAQVLFYVVSKGKFFSLGDHHIALPSGALRLSPDRTGLETDAKTDAIEKAPKFDSTAWEGAVPDNESVSKIYRHYGVPVPANLHDTGDKKDAVANGQLRRGEKLLGMPVLATGGERVGKVEDFIVSLPSGRVVVLVLSSEKYVTRDGALIAVPPSRFSVREGAEGISFDAKPEELANAPHFSVGKWPDFNREDYMRGVYGAFGVPGLFPAAPRDTAESKKADHETPETFGARDSVTALQQSNDAEDLRITREIRQRIVGVDELSVSAQNVQIITTKGRVILKGEVRNEAEHRFILSQAVRVVGGQSIDDQLTVATKH